MKLVPTAVAFVLGLLAAGPIVTAPLSMFLEPAALVVGDSTSAIPAYFNSALLGAVVSTVGLVLSLYLVLVRAKMAESLCYALLLFLIPGEIVAKGIDRLIRVMFGVSPGAAEHFAFLAFQVAYVTPYILFGCVLVVAHVGRSRFEAVRELRASRLGHALLLLRGNWPHLCLVWLVGFNLVLSETSRTTVMAEDVFGLGLQYFGPLVSGAFSTGGVSLLLTLLTLLPLVPIVPLLMFSFRRS
jgi:hypothetical protein